jgi:PAS domain-containing protein
MPFEIEEAGHFSNNRIKWLNGCSCNGYKGSNQLKNTQVSLKDKQQALKVKEQIEIALNSKLLEEESNAKFRNYIDNAPDGVLLLMKKGNYLEVNEAASSITATQRSIVQNMGIISLKKEDANTVSAVIKSESQENLLQFIKMEEL